MVSNATSLKFLAKKCAIVVFPDPAGPIRIQLVDKISSKTIS